MTQARWCLFQCQAQPKGTSDDKPHLQPDPEPACLAVGATAQGWDCRVLVVSRSRSEPWSETLHPTAPPARQGPGTLTLPYPLPPYPMPFLPERAGQSRGCCYQDLVTEAKWLLGCRRGGRLQPTAPPLLLLLLLALSPAWVTQARSVWK